MDQKTAGFEDLPQGEIDSLTAEIAAQGALLGALVARLRAYSVPLRGGISASPLDQRWVSIGATHLQEGLMALARAVARPAAF